MKCTGKDSVGYYLKIRCGLENRKKDFNFERISELDRRTVMRLGTITSGFSRQVLDNVEWVVRTNHERRNLLELNQAETRVFEELETKPEEAPMIYQESELMDSYKEDLPEGSLMRETGDGI